MAWWDHEELNPLEYISNRYKLAFPQEYGKTKEEMLETLVLGEENEAMSNSASQSPEPQFTTEELKTLQEHKVEPNTNIHVAKYIIENYESKINSMIQKSNQEFILDSNTYIYGTKLDFTEKKSISYKLKEDEYLKEVEQYINSTYSQHYAADSEIQSIEMIISAGHGDGFNMGNIQKLSARYGKKKGFERSDIMKIIHYGILQLYNHDVKMKRGK